MTLRAVALMVTLLGISGLRDHENVVPKPHTSVSRGNLLPQTLLHTLKLESERVKLKVDHKLPGFGWTHTLEEPMNYVLLNI